MRKLILAIVLIVWGAVIVLRGLFGDGIAGDGAYGAGQLAAFVFGFVMVGAGVRFVIRHVSARA